MTTPHRTPPARYGSEKYQRYVEAVNDPDPEIWQMALVMRAADCGQLQDVIGVRFHNDNTQH